ncbi:hypothetical protein M0R45_016943 [Rubus argutus]|uniref:Uncharacterized protein n=1 Tax=Rubus argutus TaxID=59490 RepID=A0AAW1XWL4_RUBAR
MNTADESKYFAIAMSPPLQFLYHCHQQLLLTPKHRRAFSPAHPAITKHNHNPASPDYRFIAAGLSKHTYIDLSRSSVFNCSTDIVITEPSLSPAPSTITAAFAQVRAQFSAPASLHAIPHSQAQHLFLL